MIELRRQDAEHRAHAPHWKNAMGELKTGTAGRDVAVERHRPIHVVHDDRNLLYADSSDVRPVPLPRPSSPLLTPKGIEPCSHLERVVS